MTKIQRPRRRLGAGVHAPFGHAFLFVASLGLWLPQPRAELLVNLDATALPEGPATALANSGTLGGSFSAVGTPANVVTVQPARGLAMTSAGHYLGPTVESTGLVGGNPRTIEAWVHNPAGSDFETIVAWGRRGGPDNSNCSFSHGVHPTWGGFGGWGAADLDWQGRNVFGRWNYVVYTYDGATSALYSDGVLANSEELTLDTWAFDSVAGNPLPMRVGAANNADGTVFTGEPPSFTLARVRVHDVALDAAAILAKFDEEKAAFDLGDADGDGMPDWYERQFTFLDPNNPADAALDQDGDGLTNLREFQLGTAPDNPDTDGDGLPDGAEVNRTAGGAPAPTDPLRADTDGDGLSDRVETDTGVFVSANDTGSDPLLPDTDGDGFGDQQEVLAGSNPNDPASVPGPIRPALVNLDATALAAGSLAAWPNNGTLGGVFTAPAEAVARVEPSAGVHGVTLNGTSHYYTGPATPAFVTGNASRTVEAWVFNPSAADEETIFAWGRRGGPDGSNVSFNHGLNATYGAVGHWGAPDIGWGDPVNVKQGVWTYVVYTYDGPTQTTRVYVDGAQTNEELLGAPLNTHATDTLGNPLPFRVGSQNESGGAPTAGLRGSLSVGEIRVFDRVLDAATIQANYTTGADKYGLIDHDNDGLPTWYERQYSFLNPNNPADAALDQDADGLSNLQEFQNGTAPDNPDTDGDGLTDGQEVNRAAGPTNPLNPDTDQDGLLDGVETGTGTYVSPANTGTDPLQADSDGDTYADGQEVIYGSNPTQAASVPNFGTPVALVRLDAAATTAGPLAVWPNAGALGGTFTAPAEFVPVSGSTNGVKGVLFNGAGDSYAGPAAPLFITGNGSRTVDAWIFNPAVNTEETVIAWGRRGGPDGSNASFIHGTDATFGALGFWGAGPDVGWGGASNLVANAWTYVAYTYDGASQTANVYVDGRLANTETFAAALVTHAVDNSPAPGRPLPFRVGIQNNADASPGGQYASLYLARLRVYDQPLGAATIAATYEAERDDFAPAPDAPSITGVTRNAQTGAVTLNWTASAGQTYAVQATSAVPGGWADIATGLTTGTYTEATPPAGTTRYYRIRVE
jgi:hypothetical protein